MCWYDGGMADFFYRQAQSMYDDDGATKLGSWRITPSGILWAIGLFVVWQLAAWAWIQSGGTVWKGYQESNVVAHTGWTATPLSSPGKSNGASINAPFFARSGKELVVKYDLATDVVAGRGIHPVRVMISCNWCMASDYRFLTVNAAGKGELRVTLPRTALYRVTITQTANMDGSESHGTYWWGVRAQRNPALTQ